MAEELFVLVEGDDGLEALPAEPGTPEDESLTAGELEDLSFLLEATDGDLERSYEALNAIADYDEADAAKWVETFAATGDLSAAFETVAADALDQFKTREGVEHHQEWNDLVEAADGDVALATQAYHANMENLAAARARLAAEPPAPLQGYDAALQEAQDEGLIAVEGRWIDRDRARNDPFDNALSDVLED